MIVTRLESWEQTFKELLKALIPGKVRDDDGPSHYTIDRICFEPTFSHNNFNGISMYEESGKKCVVRISCDGFFDEKEFKSYFMALKDYAVKAREARNETRMLRGQSDNEFYRLVNLVNPIGSRIQVSIEQRLTQTTSQLYSLMFRRLTENEVEGIIKYVRDAYSIRE